MAVAPKFFPEDIPDDREVVIKLEHVHKQLGGRNILEDLTLEVRKGETYVIIGYSGAGKSVTLRHLLGLMMPDQGSVRVFGQEVTTMTGRELEAMRGKFGVLFQSGALIGWLSVFENVELPLIEHTRMSRKKRREVIKQKLQLVNLWEDRDKPPSQISGGMKKRAGLARAIALNPEIILYDEPTSGLDPVFAREIGRLINALRKKLGVTQIVVTHDMESAYYIADRIAMFYHGRMIYVGTPDEIRSSTDQEVQHFISGGKRGTVSKRSITAILTGHPPGMDLTQPPQVVVQDVEAKQEPEDDKGENAQEGAAQSA